MVISRSPFPSTEEAFADIRREESRRRVMLQKGDFQQSEKSALLIKTEIAENSLTALMVNRTKVNRTKFNNDSKGVRRSERPWCDHCQKPGHTKAGYWEIHGKPANWALKKQGDRRNFHGDHWGNSRGGFQNLRGNRGYTANSKVFEANTRKRIFFQKIRRQNNQSVHRCRLGRSVDDMRSTSGYCTLVWGNLVTWRSKKQNVVARSSVETEYRAMAHGICEVIWVKRLYEELDMKFEGPIQLYCDNQSAMSITHNPVQHDRTRHVEVDRHFINEKLEDKIIRIVHVPTGQQLTDILTKGLSEKQYNRLLSKLGLINIYRPA
ncbi:hypothetical protein LIER_18854 [Lithospermum erythrorhizon]|uniref:Copia protein n=1 Tax=Lithospermum erythrorhizon TaxID=34254 RepID=A0AAV3QGK5_LITER